MEIMERGTKNGNLGCAMALCAGLVTINFAPDFLFSELNFPCHVIIE